MGRALAVDFSVSPVMEITGKSDFVRKIRNVSYESRTGGLLSKE